MKNTIKSLGISIACLLALDAVSQTCHFKSYSPGASDNNYKCIAVDTFGNIWTGTNRKGLFKRQGESWSKLSILADNDINQITPDKIGGVWIAQAGNSITSAALGGVEYIPAGSSTNTRYLHSYTNNNRPGYGLASAKVLTVAVDQNGTVWAGSSWSSLTSEGTYLLSPGGVSIMKPGEDRFKQITEFLGMPQYDRPYTPDITASGCINRPYDIAVGKDVVSVSCHSISDCTVDPRARVVAVSNPSAYGSPIFLKYPYSVTKSNSPFGFSTAVYPQALHFDKYNNLWLGTRGEGFGVYKYSPNLNVRNYWISFKDSLPANTIVNPHAIASSKGGFVAIGTNMGLYISMGNSDISRMKNFKHFDMGNSNLPTNNITGVAFDKEGTLWLSTDNGVFSIDFGDLKMYTLKINSSFYDPLLYRLSSFEDDSLRTLIEKFKGGECFEGGELSDMAAIAADGSKSTMFIWKGANPENVKLKIKENVLNKRDEYGYFEEIPQNDKTDSVKFRYHHPKYLDGLYSLPNPPVSQTFTIEAHDTVNDKVLYSAQVKIVLPPVLLLHGIFSNSGKLKKMKDYLISTQQYPDYMVYQGGFKDPKIGFGVELLGYSIKDYIDEIQKTCAGNSISIGKVDVLGHSTGGLATRWYMQQHFYRKDINKFISVHVPHSGSHYVDLLSDKRTFAGVELGAFLMGPTFLDKKYGYGSIKDFIPYDAEPVDNILSDITKYYTSKTLPIPPNTSSLVYEREIKTNSDLLASLNSAGATAKERTSGVYVHAVTDQFRYGITELETDFIKTFVLDKIPGVNIANEGLKSLKYAPVPNIPLYILKYIVMSKVQAGVDNGYNSVLSNLLNKVTNTTGISDIILRDYVFKEANDAVASLISQKGGLPETAVTYGGDRLVSHESYQSISHMQNSFDNQQARFQLFDLLRESALSPKFTNGFAPPKLTYSFCEDCSLLKGPIDNKRVDNDPFVANTRTEDAGIKIAPLASKQVYARDSLKFLVESTSGNLGMTSLFVYSGTTDPLYAFSKTLPCNFKMAVPKEALGSMLVVAQSIDTLNNTLYTDTLTFTVNLREGVKIDSFKIVTDFEDQVFLHLQDTTSIYVTAFYSDSTQRTIPLDTTFGLFSYTNKFGMAGVQSFTGLAEGWDMLKVQKNGWADSARIVVGPKLTTPDIVTSLPNNGGNVQEQEWSRLTSLEEQFVAYPNPSSKQVSIQARSGKSVSMEAMVYNDMGVYQASHAFDGSSTLSFSTEHLSNGIYLVRLKNLTNSKVVQTIKLVIAH